MTTETKPAPAAEVVPAMQMVVAGQTLTFSPAAKRVMLTRRATGGFEAREVAALGDGDVFVRRDAQGAARLFSRNVVLTQASKEIAEAGEAGWIITVPGYDKLNQTAGVFVLTPEAMVYQGQSVSNPHVVYSANGELLRVVARKVAIGYSPIGNLVAVDTVRHYNFEAYFLQDLHSKAAFKPDAAKYGTRWLCPFAPSAQVTEDGAARYVRHEGKVYTFRAVKDPDGIWYDITSDEVQKVMKQHIQHQKFGEVIAQSLAKRNALKAHPAISATKPLVANGQAVVQVYGWRHDLTQERLHELGDAIASGRQLPDVAVTRDEGQGDPDEVSSAQTTEVDDTDQSAGGAAAAAPAAQGQQQQPAAEEVAPSILDERPLGEQLAQLDKDAKAKGLNLTKMARVMFNSKPTSLTGEQMGRIRQVIAETADQAVAKKGGA